MQEIKTVILLFSGIFVYPYVIDAMCAEMWKKCRKTQCIYIHIYTRIFTYLFVFIYIYIFIYLFINIYIYIHAYTLMCF